MPKKRGLFYYSIIIFLLILISGCNGLKTQMPKQKNLKEPLVAGQFYPADKEELTKEVNKYLSEADKVITEKTKAVIAPHAGYIFSGPIVGKSFKQVSKDYNKVFIIAANHNGEADFEGISIPKPYTHYKTPLGEVKISDTAYKLIDDDLFKYIEGAHTMHMIEVELPFLQVLNPNFEIIPMIAGRLNDDQIDKIADELLKFDDDKTLFVFSLDMSHYHPYEDAVKLDSFCLQSLISFDYENIKKCVTDGNQILLLLITIARKQNLDITLVDYKNSGDTAGDKDRVVGYGSIAVHEKVSLNNEEKKILMNLARDTMELFVREGKKLDPDMDIISKYPRLLRNKGVFVSLDKKGNLRGSIGHLLPFQPLYLDVRDNAINAVSNDNRFDPVEPDELKDIEATISVLGVPRLLDAKNSNEILKKLKPLKDGVIINFNGRQSTYLPQVWEQLPEKEEFLSNLCQKQGSHPDCWKNPKAKLFIYNADVFYEKDFN